jgi:hypothetical protein
MVIPEREGWAIVVGGEEKRNTPARRRLPILYKPCACEEKAFLARSPGNDVWSKAEEIK